MIFSLPPWTLSGYAYQTIQLAKIVDVKKLIPPIFKIVPILPGRTASGIYLAHYNEHSTLSYNELILIKALVRYKAYIGFWCSQIFVDNISSIIGGNTIWKLSKEHAIFDWENTSFSSSPNKLKINFYNEIINFYFASRPKIFIPVKLTIPLLTFHQNKILYSKMKMTGQMYLATIHIHPGLAKTEENLLSYRDNIFSCYYNQLKIVTLPPKIIN